MRKYMQRIWKENPKGIQFLYSLVVIKVKYSNTLDTETVYDRSYISHRKIYFHIDI